MSERAKAAARSKGDKGPMRVVGIVSSPSRNGNTAILVREALKAAAARGAEIEEIHLASRDIRYCRGCFSCIKAGRCAIDDDFEQIRAKVYSCDGLVLGSPSYGAAPNAIMKNFLDRIGLFSVYTSSLRERYVLGFSTSGAYGEKKVAKELTGVVAGFFGRGTVSGFYGAKVGWGRIEMKPEAIEAAKRMGEKLFEDIEDRRQHRFQNITNRLLNTLILRRIIANNIRANKDGMLRGVYLNLRARDLVG